MLKLNLNSIRSVVQNMNLASERKLRAAEKALIEGGLKVKADAVKITPLDLSNLRGSAYTLWAGGGAIQSQFFGEIAARLASEQGQVLNDKRNRIADSRRRGTLMVIVGFTAYYALYVHENVGANFKTPGTQAKYLALPLQRNATAIKQLVIAAMRAA